MTPQPIDVSNSVLNQKIDALQQTLNEVRASLVRLDDEARKAEIESVRNNARIENKADAANARIDRLAAQMVALEHDIPALMLAYKVLVFIGGALGLSIIALIWALITGQAHISFAP